MSLSRDVRTITGNGAPSRWNVSQPLGTSVVLTYSFETTRAAYDTNRRGTFTEFTEAHKSYIRDALQTWEKVSGLTFLEVQSRGQMAFSMIDIPLDGTQETLGFAYRPGTYTLNANNTSYVHYDRLDGDVFFNSAAYAQDANEMGPDKLGFRVAVHEIGHALGFKHPFDGTPQLPSFRQTADETIMSYDDTGDFARLGRIDIEAAQAVYGKRSADVSFNESEKLLIHTGTAGAEAIHGTELKDFMQGLGGNDLVFGADGDDFIFVAGSAKVDGGNGRDTVITQAGNAEFADTGGVYGANVTVAVSPFVDDVYLGGFGNDKADGGLGHDVLIGDRLSQFLSGEDTLIGGEGQDFLQGGGNADVFRFKRGDNTDKNNRAVGPDVIGQVGEGTLHQIMNGARPTIDQLAARAGRDFQIGIDKIELSGFSSFQQSDARQNLDRYLTDTVQGVELKGSGIHILFVGLTEAELLAADFNTVFDFI